MTHSGTGTRNDWKTPRTIRTPPSVEQRATQREVEVEEHADRQRDRSRPRRTRSGCAGRGAAGRRSASGRWRPGSPGRSAVSSIGTRAWVSWIEVADGWRPATTRSPEDGLDWRALGRLVVSHDASPLSHVVGCVGCGRRCAGDSVPGRSAAGTWMGPPTLARADRAGGRGLWPAAGVRGRTPAGNGGSDSRPCAYRTRSATIADDRSREQQPQDPELTEHHDRRARGWRDAPRAGAPSGRPPRTTAPTTGQRYRSTR